MQKFILDLIAWLNPAAFWEAIKESLRVELIAIVAVVVSGINPTAGTVSINVAFVYLSLAVAILKGVDKWLHEIGKANNNALITGLTRF